jgi:hypothetical protein
MGRTCSTHGRNIYAYEVLEGNPEGNTLKRHKWDDNIKMDI